MNQTIEFKSPAVEMAFCQAAAKIAAQMPCLISKSAAAAKLRDQIKTRPNNWTPDYQINALAFNQAYFLKNLFKCLAALQFLKQHRFPAPPPTRDVGGGAGTFTLAYNLIHRNIHSAAWLIDKSRAQQTLAAGILRLFDFPNCHFSNDLHYLSNLPALNLLSYCACENKNFDLHTLPPGPILIIDYAEQLAQIEQTHANQFIIERFDLVIPLPPTLIPLLQETHITVHLAWLTPAQQLLNQYFKIWREHDIYNLENIFAADAGYLILQKNYTFRGLKEIQEYWCRNSRRQRELRLDYQLTNLSETTISAHFTARFFDLEENSYQKIIGLIDFKIANGQIIELCEIYNKKTTN